jgi:hypothetical protein
MLCKKVAFNNRVLRNVVFTLVRPVGAQEYSFCMNLTVVGAIYNTEQHNSSNAFGLAEL